MKKLYKLTICFLIAVMAIPSCTKDLQLEPISVLSNSSFWKTPDDATAALYGMYSRFRPQAAVNLYIWGEARSEIVSPALSGRNYSEYYENFLEPSTVGLPGWQGLYSVVHDANLLIKYVPTVTFPNASAKNDILAQAYTMRAYLYFLMIKTWGDVPLITDPTESFNPELLQRERAPKEQVFALIKSDLNTALSLYSSNNFVAGRNIWTKAGANALKADVYLWTGKLLNGGSADFTTALNATIDAQTADVALLSNYASVFDYNNKGNKEIVMAIRFHELETSANTISENFYMSATGLLSSIDAATKALIGTVGGATYCQASALVRNQFSVDDQRRAASFVEVFTPNSSGAPTFYTSVALKFRGVVTTGVRRFKDDVIIYRYSDILLMKAEAKNALGQDPTTEMNLIRQRAYGTKFSSYVFVNGTPAQNDDAILKERLLEFIFEGKRWWDLIRFDKAFQLVPSLQTKVGKDYLKLFPIPSDILSLETKVKQNPGYTP